MCRLFLYFLLIISISFSVVFVYLGMLISFVKSLYWWCSTLISIVLVLGIWYLANTSYWLPRLFEDEQSSKTNKVNLDSSGSTSQTNLLYDPFLTKRQANTQYKENVNQTKVSTCLGPKLFSPRIKAKKLKGSRTKMTTTSEKRKRNTTRSNVMKNSRDRKSNKVNETNFCIILTNIIYYRISQNKTYIRDNNVERKNHLTEHQKAQIKLAKLIFTFLSIINVESINQSTAVCPSLQHYLDSIGVNCLRKHIISLAASSLQF